jgi:hypothetical protein
MNFEIAFPEIMRNGGFDAIMVSPVPFAIAGIEIGSFGTI